MGTLFKNGLLITASDMHISDLLVEGEEITLIGKGIPEDGHEIVDCTGKYLMPGGVDVHTHLHLPLAETSSNSDFNVGHMAAAFGGTTTHIDFAIQPKGGSLADGLAIHHEKAKPAQIDYSFHITITDPRPEVLAEIPTMEQAGVPSLKVLMAYKESFQIDDTSLFKIMRTAAEHGMLVMVHAENGDIEYQLRQELREYGLRGPNWHPASRPAEIETEATGRAITMASLTGCPLYVVHMTCEGAVDALRRGRAEGHPVMGETCPQYVYLTATDNLSIQSTFEAAKYVCSPPIREQRDHQILWSALRDGTIQVVATDHCDFWFDGGHGPWQEWAETHDNHSWAEYEAQDPSYRRPGKELGKEDFSRIPNGLPGIEDRMLVMWQLGVNGGQLTPSRFVETMCTNPARIFGLYPRKGTLAPGSDADIIVWDPEADVIINAGAHHMRTDYNCYEGLRVQGKPTQVYLRGKKLVDGDDWLGENGYGQFIARKPGAQVM